MVILKHHAVESVQNPRLSVSDRRGVTADLRTGPERFGADNFDIIGQEAREKSRGIASAPDTRGDGVGEQAGHLEELFARLLSDDHLEVAHHHREGVRPDDRTDTVDALFVAV